MHRSWSTFLRERAVFISNGFPLEVGWLYRKTDSEYVFRRQMVLLFCSVKSRSACKIIVSVKVKDFFLHLQENGKDSFGLQQRANGSAKTFGQDTYRGGRRNICLFGVCVEWQGHVLIAQIGGEI